MNLSELVGSSRFPPVDMIRKDGCKRREEEGKGGKSLVGMGDDVAKCAELRGFFKSK